MERGVRSLLSRKWTSGLKIFNVAGNISKDISRVIYSTEIERALIKWKKKDNIIFEQIESAIRKILQEPLVGKPLRYAMKNRRRVHVGSFILVYEFHNGELRFLDFDHHDRVYKK